MMKMIDRLPVFLMFMVVFAFQSYSQESSKWTTYTTADGLAGNDVRAIAEDHEGAMWFGTDKGVSRYKDGLWQTFNKANSGLYSDNVYCILVDSRGALWFGTWGGAVARYQDGEWYTFYTVNSGLSGNYVIDMIEDSRGALWFATGYSGVSKYEQNTWTTYDTTNSGIAANYVLRIYEDRDQTLWFGTGHRDGTLREGLTSFRNGEWYTFNTVNSGLAENEVRGIVQDEDGAMWFATGGGGINRFKDGEWERHSFYEYTANRYTDALMDAKGTLWFSARIGGVARLYQGIWYLYTTSNTGLASGSVNTLFEDSQGILWFGTTDGVSRRINQPVWKSHDITNSDIAGTRVNAICETGEGMWLGTGDGLSLLDNNNNWSNFTTENSDLSSDFVQDLFCDRDSILWMYTAKEVAQIDNSRWTFFDTTNSGLAGDTFISEIVQDSTGGIWFSCKGKGLSRYTGHLNPPVPKLLVDESHNQLNTISYQRAVALNPEHPDWVYLGILKSRLDDYVITELNETDGLGPLLQNTNVLLLAAPYGEFSSNEVNNILSFVAAGGGLIFMGDGGMKGDINSLLTPFGIQFDNTALCKTNDARETELNFDVDHISPHQVTAGISQYKINWGASFEVTAPAFALAWSDSTSWRDLNWDRNQDHAEPTGPFAVICGCEYGKGRVVCFSDNAFHDDYIKWENSPNDDLFFNALEWITGKGAVWETFNSNNSGLASNTIRGLAVDNDGRVWAGGEDGTLSRYQEGSWQNVGQLYNGGIESIYTDREGKIWFSSWGNGVVVYDHGNWYEYNISNCNISSNYINSMVQDDDGAMWFATANGVSLFKEGIWTSMKTEYSGLNSNRVESVIQDSQGSMWFAHYVGGADQYYGDKISPDILLTQTPAHVIGNPSPLFTFKGKDNQTIQERLLYSFAVMDSASTVSEDDYSSFSSLTYAYVPVQNNGIYTFYVRARDFMGNISTPAAFTFTVDITYPTTVIDYPKQNDIIHQTIPIIGFAFDDSPIKDFDYYDISYRKQLDREYTAWAPLLTNVGNEVKSDTLALWNTRGLRGTFQLKLYARDTLQHESEDIITLQIVDVIQSVKNNLGGYIGDDTGGIQLYFPPNSLADQSTFQIKKVPKTEIKAINTELYKETGLVYDIMPSGIKMNKAGKLSLSYADSSLAGISDEKKLIVLRYHEDIEEWLPLGGTVDIRAKRITVPLSESGRYGLFENMGADGFPSLSEINCQPRVFSPAGGGYDTHTAISFSLSGPGEVKVNIYNLSGRLICQVADNLQMNGGSNLVHWDGRDYNGEVVPSGLYIVAVEGDGKRVQKTVSVLHR
ncbi:T9SS type A sorting domain-containing protein [candidate division KSB1 bacterium]|nr:T9SS type A sorting domain-containing protein [candidate division KSB1 bacterium]